MTKRSTKARNIRRRGKSWVAVYMIDGRQRWRSFPSRELAELHLAQVRLDDARGEYRPPSKVRFGDALDAWLAHVEHERRVKPSTLRDYRSCAERWLRPGFGTRQLDGVTTETITRWRSDAMARSKEPLPRRQAEKLLALLHGIFVYAADTYGLTGNPAAKVKRLPVRYDAAEFSFYEPEQVHALVRAAKSETDGALFLTAAFSGLRLGELLGLRVRDVDFGAECLRVSRNVVAREVGTPKSGKSRSVPMVGEVATALAKLLSREEFTGDDDPVFVGRDGGYLDASALRRRFKTARDKAELPPLRFHDLRHSFGSLAARKAESVTELQFWMGHADAKTTQRYTHYRSRGGEAARLAEAFTVEQPARVVQESAVREGATGFLPDAADEADSLAAIAVRRNATEPSDSL